jgi:predicted transcriptional regulator
MSDRIQVIEENVRKYINHVFVDYLSLPDRELKVLLTLKSFAWYAKEDCHPSLGKISKICKKSKSQVREILRILEVKGLIRTEQDIGDVSNYYITNKFIEPEKLSTDKATPPEIRRTPPTGNPVPPPPEIRCTPPTGNPVPPPPEIRCLNNSNRSNTKLLNNIYCARAQDFDTFWSIYPKKRGKPAAIKAFEKIYKESTFNLEKMLTDIKTRTAKDIHWQRKQYIPYPATYLNAKVWENDEITLEETPKQKPKEGEIKSNVPWYNEDHAHV